MTREDKHQKDRTPWWRRERVIDFGVLQVAEGARPAAVRDDPVLQRAATRRLQELQAEFVAELEAEAERT